jgi:hypothetical protein
MSRDVPAAGAARATLAALAGIGGPWYRAENECRGKTDEVRSNSRVLHDATGAGRVPLTVFL